MQLSADKLRGIIENYISSHRKAADGKKLNLPDDFLDSSDTAIVGEHLEGRETGQDLIVENLRTSFRTALLSRIDAVVHDELRQIQKLETSARKQAVKDFLKDCLDKSFELFWGTFKSMCRLPDELDPENPEDLLVFNEDIALGCIETVSERQDSAEIYKKIRCQTNGSRANQRKSIKFFRGASVPDAFPLFEKFAALCSANEVKYEVFGKLLAKFEAIVEKATGGKQKGYPIPGVLGGWRWFILYLDCFAYGALRQPIFVTQFEYLPMLVGQSMRAFYVVYGKTEEEISNSIKWMIANSQNPKNEEEIYSADRIVLMTSVRRDGQRVDVNKIMQEVKAQYPTTHFIIDGAQDHMLYPDADCVFYGKRFGGTGTGVMMVAKDLKGGDERTVAPLNTLVHKDMKLQSGFHVQNLARTFATLRCEFSALHFANDFRDLLESPDLWHFRGGGTYIDRQVDKIRKFADSHPSFSRNFEVVVSHDPGQWKSGRIITFRQQKNSNIDVKHVAEVLKTHGIQVDWFSLKQLEGYDDLLSAAREPYSFNRSGEFLTKLMRFQAQHFNYLTHSMLSTADVFNWMQYAYRESQFKCGDVFLNEETMYMNQLDYFQYVIKKQEAIRILIDVRMTEEDIDSFLEIFNDAVLQEQQAA